MNVQNFVQHIYDKADDRHRQAIAEYGEYLYKRTPKSEMPRHIIMRAWTAFGQINYGPWWFAKRTLDDDALTVIEDTAAVTLYVMVRDLSEAVRS